MSRRHQPRREQPSRSPFDRRHHSLDSGNSRFRDDVHFYRSSSSDSSLFDDARDHLYDVAGRHGGDNLILSQTPDRIKKKIWDNR